jgi:hypothetical protein
VFRNVSPSGHPNIFLLGHVLHELPQTLRTAGFAGDSRVQRNGHHLTAFSVQAVERVFEILEVCVAGGADEARRHVKLPIIALRLRSAAVKYWRDVGIAYNRNCTAP